jgi:hypothetical protein
MNYGNLRVKQPYKLYKNSVHKKQESIEGVIGPENSCHNKKLIKKQK